MKVGEKREYENIHKEHDIPIPLRELYIFFTEKRRFSKIIEYTDIRISLDSFVNQINS